MHKIERILSRPTAKPYRTRRLSSTQPSHFNQDGHLDFDDNDIENPKNWSSHRRSYVTAIAVLMVLNATFASSAPSGCLVGISEEFKVSRVVAGLVITVFLLGYCAGPLMFAPLSEFYGRRWVFYCTFSGFTAFNFLCAFAPNFASLLIGRLITGVFASAPLTNAPGVLADVWGPIQRSNAMAFFSAATFVGPAVGPVIGGFLELKKDWRWIFYVQLMLGAITELLMFTIPETYPPIALLNKARRLRRSQNPQHQDIVAPAEAHGRKLASIFKVALTRPWQILFDPISFLVAIYLSVVYTLLYMLFSIYPIVFQQRRGWNSGVGELPLIGTVIGACLGGFIVYLSSRRDAKRMEAGHEMTPEDRLPVAMLGGILFPITMFWFGWTAEYNSVHWFVPVLAGTFLSTSILLIFVAYLNYLTDTYLMYTASAIAANTICRSACGAAAPLFTNQMFTALGVGGGGSLIGGVAALLAPIPFIFYKYGKTIRSRSKFAPTKEGSSKDDKDKQKENNGNDDEEKQGEHKNSSNEEIQDASRSATSESTATANSEHERMEVYGSDYPLDSEKERPSHYPLPTTPIEQTPPSRHQEEQEEHAPKIKTETEPIRSDPQAPQAAFLRSVLNQIYVDER